MANLIQGDLTVTHPKLVKEWHPTKNEKLKPIIFTAGSSRKVWWKCPKGHEYQATINNRCKGSGCPYCSGRYAIKGVNDLATTHPELVKEWHPTKNGNLKPTDIKAGSSKKVWWYLPYDTEDGRHFDFEWEASIYSRIESGCPYLSGKTIFIGFNDLATTHPELVKEWHPTKNGDLKPTDVKAGSNKKVWWKCSEGHEWTTIVADRIRGYGCPYCSGRYVIEGMNDLATTHPELAKEWHPTKNGDLKPTDIKAGSNKKIWWKCSKGHEWNAIVANRNRGYGCPYCCGKYTIDGVNDLATTHPELAKEWHPTKNGDLKPTDVKAGSNKKVWWKCSKGHEWNVKVFDRTQGSCCPYCSKIYAIKGVNDLATTHPELAKEWHPTKNIDLKPTDVKAGSNKKVWWYLPYDTEDGRHFDFEWESTISHRVYCNNGCPYLSNQKLWRGFNDLATTHSELAKEWHPTKNVDLKPTDVVAGSNKKIWWKCPKGHEWKAVISSRIQGCGCPYCSGRYVIEGVNDLATTHPELAKEWHPTKNGDLKPTDIKAGSGKKVWWKCSKGHEWQTKTHFRMYGNGCPICNESHLEKSTRNVLSKYGYNFTEQVKFDLLIGLGGNLLSFDFAINNSDGSFVLVECQGIQHYEPVSIFGGKRRYKKQLEYDRLKQEFCEQNHILLIQIPYCYDEEDIDAIFRPE